MYKTLLFCCFSILVFLTSCKKDNNSQDDLKSNLTGKWTYVAGTENHYTAQGVHISSETVSYPVSPGDYIEFKSDGTWNQKFGSTQSGTYSITSSTRFELINSGIDNPCRVTDISSSSLTFIVEGTKVAGAGYTEVTHSLKK